MKKRIIQKKEKNLLELRHEGKKEALEINAMKAHGKIMGMDAFSWVNPNMDQLTSALSTFPFRIIWVATFQQLKNCLSIEPNLSIKMETVIIHNTTKNEVSEEDFFRINNILKVKTAKDALQMVNALKKEKCVFLFSTEGKNAKDDKKEFEKFIARYR